MQGGPPPSTTNGFTTFCKIGLIPIRIKNDNCVASPCRAAALSAASRLVLLSNANWNDLVAEQLRRTAERMAQAIPDSLITGFERFANTIELPDPDDRHVLAAALVGHADAIVTFNLKDFPATTLEPLGLEAQHPDDFVVNQLHLNLPEALKAVKAQRARLMRPTQTAAELLATLARCGLPQTASLLAENAELI